MKCAIYARVSSDGQDYEDQLAELRAFAKRQQWETVEYLEKLSGKEGNLRPALEQLLRDAQNRLFEVVVVWKLDRFGRSTLDTLTNIKTLSAFGVRFLVSTHPAIDTDDRSPLGNSSCRCWRPSRSWIAPSSSSAPRPAIRATALLSPPAGWAN